MRQENNPYRLTSFSPDGQFFASLSSDSSVKIWDTSSGSVVADWKDSDTKSNVSYSCISCCNVGKKCKKERKTLLLALGTPTGDVLAVDVLSSNKIWVNSNCHSGEVVALSFANNGRLIYTGGADGIVCDLNSENGELKGNFKASKRAIVSLSISHDEQFIAVTSKISRVFNLEDKSELFKFPSDIGPTQQIALSDDGRMAVSSSLSSENEEIQVWSCEIENKNITKSRVLSVKNHPVMIECRGSLVLSVLNKGVIYVWNLENTSEKEVLPAKILIKGKEGKKKSRFPIFSANLCELKQDKCVNVQVVYGSMNDLKFKTVEIKEWGQEICLTNEESQDHKATESDVEIKKPDPEQPTPTKKERVKKRTASDVESTEEKSLPSEEPMQETIPEFDTDEPTMEEKLASLNLVRGYNKMNNQEDKREKASPLESLKPPSADSVHVLLRQALRADDRSLLLDCLFTKDEKVIAKSISLLMPADVIKLLKSLVLMIQSRGAVMVCVIPWLRSLLSQQASSIVSQDSSLQLLNSLYQLIDSRVSTFGSALQLSTCLDCNFSGMTDYEVDEEEAAPPIIYEDKDSDDESAAGDDESGEAMDTDDDYNDEQRESGEEGMGNVINAPQFSDSDGSEVMSD